MKIIYFIVFIFILSSCQKGEVACFGGGADPATHTATLDASCSELAFTYQWTFGDGTDTTLLGISTVTHTYPQAGNYTVILHVARKDGISHGKDRSTYTRTIFVP